MPRARAPPLARHRLRSARPPALGSCTTTAGRSAVPPPTSRSLTSSSASRRAPARPPAREPAQPRPVALLHHCRSAPRAPALAPAVLLPVRGHASPRPADAVTPRCRAAQSRRRQQKRSAPPPSGLPARSPPQQPASLGPPPWRPTATAALAPRSAQAEAPSTIAATAATAAAAAIATTTPVAAKGTATLSPGGSTAPTPTLALDLADEQQADEQQADEQQAADDPAAATTDQPPVPGEVAPATMLAAAHAETACDSSAFVKKGVRL